MQIFKLYPRGFAANTYFLTEDGKTAVVIDPAQPRALDRAQELGLQVKYVLLTHGHFDHIGGCAAFRAAGAQVACHSLDKSLAEEENLAREFGYPEPDVTVDFTFGGADALSLCGMHIRVLGTPGHTAGSCCFLVGGAIFSGDTLFAGGHGRTDLPTGSAAAMERSLARLFSLEGDYPVYTGHGEDTTLAKERRC